MKKLKRIDEFFEKLLEVARDQGPSIIFYHLYALGISLSLDEKVEAKKIEELLNNLPDDLKLALDPDEFAREKQKVLDVLEPIFFPENFFPCALREHQHATGYSTKVLGNLESALIQSLALQ